MKTLIIFFTLICLCSVQAKDEVDHDVIGILICESIDPFSDTKEFRILDSIENDVMKLAIVGQLLKTDFVEPSSFSFSGIRYYVAVVWEESDDLLLYHLLADGETWVFDGDGYTLEGEVVVKRKLKKEFLVGKNIRLTELIDSVSEARGRWQEYMLNSRN